MDTLAQQKARPLQVNIDLSGASLQHVMNGYPAMQAGLEAKEGAIKSKPEQDALWFYVQQHAMGLIERNLDPDEPMGRFGFYVELYHATIQQKALRMFYYLLLICTRESRHMRGDGKQKVYEKFPSIVDFHKNHVQDSSAEAAIQALIDNAPDITLGEYAAYLVKAFTMPSFGSGYGGPAWARVARPLRDFVHGKISAEILMDTAFTLAHNNGPIFNKGMLFMPQSTAKLRKILDVQRSGQIPQLIASGDPFLSLMITPELREYVESFKLLDGGFGGSVDWTQVKNIDGYAGYKVNIAAQKEKESTGANWKEKLVAMKAADADMVVKVKAIAAKNALLKDSIEILPGVFVAKDKRSQS